MCLKIFLLVVIISLLIPRTAAAEKCVNAPFPRLTVGEPGQVAQGIDGLRLRALPAIGAGTLATLNRGYPFTVLSGPSCNSGFNWWHVELQTGLTGWLAEGEWARYYLIPVDDEPKTICNIAESPWLYALLSHICSFLP